MAVSQQRVILEIIEGGQRRPPGGGGGGSGPPPIPPDQGSDASAIFGSHISLSEALVRRLGEDWHCAAGQWHCWDGRRWEPEKSRLVFDQSRSVCKEEGALCDSAELARKIMSSSAVYAAVSLASADRAIAAVMEEFDRDPWLLNTPDGVLDLRTGQLAPHDRALKMTKLAGAGPMGPGECPTFAHYLNEATGGDEALQRYLQRVAGYCLTGSIEEHCILFFHGPGGSGKSTFLLVLQDVLGDYAVNSPMNAFTVATGERHPTEFAHFHGARVVTASEVEEGMRWDEGKLKAISGGDKITARFMRGDFFTFEPQFKLILAGNHRPRMRSADDAMRRRMQVIPFRHKPKSVDKTLREKLQAELPAILRWAMLGELERRKLGGLNPPRAVVAATNDYFKAENTLGRWLDERCLVSTAEREPDRCEAAAWSETRGLYRDFQDWARRVNEWVPAERVFSEKLEQMGSGIEKQQHSRTRRAGFRGVLLRSATPDLFEGGSRGAAGQPDTHPPTRRADPFATSTSLTNSARPGELFGPVEDDPGDEYDR